MRTTTIVDRSSHSPRIRPLANCTNRWVSPSSANSRTSFFWVAASREPKPPRVSQPDEDFVSRALAVVESIPEGRVMSYGDVAAAIGSRAARGVGQVMAYYGSDVAWWRVVRASGHPATDHEQRALEHFRAESTPLKWSSSGVFRIDLALARWTPGEDERNEE